jgi:hypothetical protein
LLSRSKVQRRDASRHALHGFDLSFVLSGCKHLILRVRHESQARLATTRFGVRGPVDVPELGVESAIWGSCHSCRHRHWHGYMIVSVSGVCANTVSTCIHSSFAHRRIHPPAASPPRHFRNLERSVDQLGLLLLRPSLLKTYTIHQSDINLRKECHLFIWQL